MIYNEDCAYEPPEVDRTHVGGGSDEHWTCHLRTASAKRGTPCTGLRPAIEIARAFERPGSCYLNR